MNRATLMKRLDVFPANGADHARIDKMVLRLSGRSAYRPKVDLRAPLSTVGWTVPAYGVKESWREGRTLFWSEESPRATIEQEFYRRNARTRRPGTAQTVQFNPLRALAEVYEADGLAVRSTAMGEDNLIRPWVVDPGRASVDLRTFLPTWMRARRDGYMRSTEALFGIELDAPEVALSATRFELTWDYPCTVSRAAPGRYWDAWRLTLPDAALHNGGWLSATGAGGEHYRLYSKTAGILRFEVVLPARRVRKHLGHGLRLLDTHELDADLRALGAYYYPRIQEVQARVLDSTVWDPTDLLLALSASTRRRGVVRTVVASLLASGRVHSSSDAMYRVLCDLQSMGVVKLVSRGSKSEWTMEPSAFRTATRLTRHLAALEASL